MNKKEAKKVLKNINVGGATCSKCVFDNETECFRNGKECQMLAIEKALQLLEQKDNKINKVMQFLERESLELHDYDNNNDLSTEGKGRLYLADELFKNKRNIKFRGKREDNSKWIIGNLIHSLNRYDNGMTNPYYEEYEDNIYYIEEIETWEGFNEGRVEILPDTIGQYTRTKR